ncbi:MAG: discoidin domain-containing protein [Deltaproteobacteria bacterium]|nr:discoidin domain-containing protein [Deltaproteobacteria bacterium]
MRPYTLRACDLGDRAACTSAAQADASLAETHALSPFFGGTITVPGFDYLATLDLGCTRGTWRSCAKLGDLFRAEACSPEEGAPFELAPDPARSQAADLEARTLADKACLDNDEDACRWVAERTMLGCGQPKDTKAWGARFEMAHTGLGSRCLAGELQACITITRDCLAIDPARVTLPNVDQPAPLRPRTVLASSTLPRWKGYRFDARQVTDGDLGTSWQPIDKKTGGVGQWLELDFGAPVIVSAITIGNGLQRVDQLGDLFALNNRIRKATLTFSDGTSLPVSLAKDARGLITLPMTPRRISSLRLTVEGIWRGDKWNDLALAELSAVGIPSPELQRAPRPSVCSTPTNVSERLCREGQWSACELFLNLSRDEQDAGAGGAVDVAFTAALEVCDPTHKPAPAAESKAAAACYQAASLLAQSPQHPRAAEAQALMTRACKLGHDAACGELFCHGEILGASQASGAFEPAPESICDAACKRGDLDACLAALEREAPGASDDLDQPKTRRFLDSLSGCDTVAACQAEAAATGLDDPRPIGYSSRLSTLSYIAALARACTFGSANDCQRAKLFADEGAFADGLEARACRIEPGCGNGPSPASPEPVGPDLAASLARCAQFDGAACRATCTALEQTLDKSFRSVEPPSVEALARALANLPGAAASLGAEDLFHLCIEAAIEDPCACGCC